MEKNLEEFISRTGEPSAFAVHNDSIRNFHAKTYLNKYNVLTSDEAIEKYPDAIFWITYDNKVDALNAANILLKKISPNKIKFIHFNFEYRKGCFFLGHFLDYRLNAISPCCVVSNTSVAVKGSIPEQINQWQKHVTQLIDDIKNERPNICSKCKHLKYGFYNNDVKLDNLCFGSNHPGDTCNLKCVYCFAEESFKTLKNTKQTNLSTYEILRQLSEMPEYNNSNFQVDISNGEFCVNKDFDKIFDILLKTKWKVKFVSNLTVYREKFAQFLKTGRTVYVLSSLDCGTRETFLKIKRADLFDKVVENLKKYPFENVDLQLKYIFLEGLNDNITDIDGFYNIVKDVGCKKIVLSSNLSKPFTENMRNLASRLIQKAKADGIKVLKSSYLAPADEKFIDECINLSNISFSNQTQYSATIVEDGKSIISNPSNTGQIDGAGTLYLNANLAHGSNAECIIKLGKNSSIIVNGNVQIEPNTIIELKDNSILTIESGIIETGTILKCKHNIQMGNNVKISPNCYITDCDEDDNEKTTKSVKSKPLTIADNVKIGYGTVITKGVNISKNIVVKPYSVVTKNISTKK
ncbi:radical SAM protein [bacterium]|nr:radical SAM protein [bacterium]